MIRVFQALIIAASIMALSAMIGGCATNELAPQPPSNSCHFTVNAKGFPVHLIAPMYFRIDPEVPVGLHQAILNAADKWNGAIGHDMLIIGDSPDTHSQSKIIWDTENKHLSLGKEGVCKLQWFDDVILSSDIAVNAKDYCIADGVAVMGYCVDMESLMLHEFGHALGLAHISEEQMSVMYPMLAVGQLRRNLTVIDIESIKCQY